MKMARWIVVVGIVVLSVVLMRSIAVEKADYRAEAETPKEISSITKLTEASNSDGSKKIVGSSEVKGDTVKYVFETEDVIKKIKQTLFEAYLDKSSSIIIPFNSWSSDDKYVFLEVKNPGWKTYYVFRQDGSVFNDGKKYIDIMEYWKTSGLKREIDHVSGWAGPDLMMLYFKNDDGSPTNAYWFAISSRKFMNVREL